jgi:hypothetical protein
LAPPPEELAVELDTEEPDDDEPAEEPDEEVDEDDEEVDEDESPEADVEVSAFFEDSAASAFSAPVFSAPARESLR